MNIAHNDSAVNPADELRNELVLSASWHLLKHSREKIFIKDKELIYRAASEKFAVMAGWTQESDLIGKTDFEIFADPDLAMRYREDDKKLIETQADLIDYIEPITEKDGRPRYASTSKFILRDENGQFMGLVGISKDITMEYYLQRNRVRELEYLFSLPQDVYFAAYLDIDDWRIISEQHQTVHGFDFTFHNNIQTLANRAHKRLVDDRCAAGAFYRNFTHAVLTELYHSGSRESVMEYQRFIAKDEVRWVRDEIKFLVDAISGHLCMMLVVRDVHQRKLDEAEHIRLSERDEVTGLLNRRATMQLIREHLAQSKPGEQHALFMIDADYFKDVNNTYGHQAGDQALADFAMAISRSFESTDLIGRIGGDEFFVLMPKVPCRAAVEQKTSALLDALRSVRYETISLSASIGVSFYPNDSTTLEGLYALSDKAMYAVKDAGRNGVCFAADLAPKQN